MNDIITLEKLVEKYPWYSLAHYELYGQMCSRGEEYGRAYLSKAAIHLYTRDRLYIPSGNIKKTIEPVISAGNEPAIIDSSVLQIDQNEPDSSFSEGFSFELEDDIKEPVSEKRVIITGGDYFTTNDFRELNHSGNNLIDRFIIEKPSISRAGQDPSAAGGEIEGSDIFEDINFYTETLAKIYADQGFYKRAIDVYAKLILLYPEKSTYFASLVQEIKNKNNI